MQKRHREMTMDELEKDPYEMTPKQLKVFNEEISLTDYPVISPKKQTGIDLSPEEMKIFEESITTHDNNKGFKIDEDYLKELDDFNFTVKSAGRRRRKTRKNSKRRGKKSRSHRKRRTHRKH